MGNQGVIQKNLAQNNVAESVCAAIFGLSKQRGAIMTTDKSGRTYAKLSELKAGDSIELDGGFTCATAGRTKVQEDDGGLYFACGDGHHYLSGQADDGVHCVGVYKAS